MVKWSKAVIARDGKCCDCGATQWLHAYRVDKTKLLEVENGAVLCGNCRKVRYEAGLVRKVRRRGKPWRAKLLAKIAELEGERDRLVAEVKAAGRKPKERFSNPWPGE